MGAQSKGSAEGNGGMDGSDVEAVLQDVLATLRPQVGADWDVPAGELQWSCRATAAHLAHDLLAYAVVARLFPDQPGADLLWCTGRIALPGRPRRPHWTPRAATSD
jgi:hypothetical protein